MREIELTHKGEVVFTMNIDDWECASDPICMLLVTEDEWERIGKALQGEVDEYDEIDEDAIDGIWADYEIYCNRIGSTFYYEDMTDDEYERFKTLEGNADNEGVKNLCQQVYNRIKKEQ